MDKRFEVVGYFQYRFWKRGKETGQDGFIKAVGIPYIRKKVNLSIYSNAA